VVGDETSIGDGGKSGGYGDKVGGQETASRAMVRATVMRRGTTTAIVAGSASVVRRWRDERRHNNQTVR